MDKIDKTKEDYEFEKSQEECTFAPKLMSKQPKYIRERVTQNTGETLNNDASRPMTAKERQAKTEQKNLERMKKAREEKDRKNAFRVRGEPKSKPMTEVQM